MKDYVRTNTELTKEKLIHLEDTGSFTYQQTSKRLQMTLDVILPFVSDKTLPVLDIGCRDGYLLELLRDSGFTNLRGVDVCADAVNRATKKNLNAFIDDAQELTSVKGNEFSTIMASHCIEHAPSPEKIIENIYDLLTPGGITYIAVPREKKPKIVPTSESHYSFFPRKRALKKMFDKKKWDVLELRYEKFEDSIIGVFKKK